MQSFYKHHDPDVPVFVGGKKLRIESYSQTPLIHWAIRDILPLRSLTHQGPTDKA